MMPILIPVTFVGTLLFAFVGTGRHGLRQSFVYAATVYTLCLVSATEVLSIWNLLRFGPVLGFWTGCTLISAFCLWTYGDLSATRLALQRVWTMFRTAKFALGAIIVILAIILLIAVVAPPNNTDSLAYQMVRVAMRMQQGNVARFLAPYLPQLYYPPLSEWNILHFQILADGDRFACTTHWVALAGCGVLASLLTTELNRPFRTQVLAAVIAVTLPMGLLQGASTQGNLFVAF